MQQIQLDHADAFNHNFETNANPTNAKQNLQRLHQPEQVTLLYATTSTNQPPTSFLVRNDYDKTLAHAVTAHGGFILEAGQKMISGLFMKDGQNDPAFQAVSAGLALIDQVMTANEYRLASGSTTLRLGIGISTGLASLQQDGETVRLVNETAYQVLETARQLCNLNQQTPFPAAFISQETFALLSTFEWHIENMGPVWLPDQSNALTIHAVMRPVQFH